MRLRCWLTLALCLLGAATGTLAAPPHDAAPAGLSKIETIVVIYGENRSFDHLYGLFPGANGIANALRNPASYLQRDRGGSILKTLPPVWKKPAYPDSPPEADPAFPRHLANRPFRIDRLGEGHGLAAPTRDAVHKFYQNQAQIDGGRNDRFAAVSDAGGLVMGHYDGSTLPMWALARKYTLADNFFMGVFGGSFLNHFWLVCACTPQVKDYPGPRAVLANDDQTLLPRMDSPSSALQGWPLYVQDGQVSPDGYVVNALQPPYQPSFTRPARDGDRRYADESDPGRLPPQYATTIGDTLTAKGIDWAWYAGGWNAALADGMQDPAAPLRVIYATEAGALNFQPHHMPFNYFARFDPITAADERRTHLKDEVDLLADIQAGRLPPVVFYKPAGILNEHPGYANLLAGDTHIAALVGALEHSSQWPHMLVIVTYDENGGFWDHVAPPKGDRWGPGTRVPAIIISPYAKRGFVDHTRYDTTSILQLITRRFELAPLPGARTQMGDLTNALDL